MILRMKTTWLIIIVLVIIALSGAGLYAVTHPSCCMASKTTQAQIQPYQHVSPSDFNAALASGKYKLIDVRTLQEYNAGHIKGASQADYYQTKDFYAYLDNLNKNGNYLIYCRTGHRSEAVLQIMQEKGFTSVSDLDGGYNAWIGAGYPTVD